VRVMRTGSGGGGVSVITPETLADSALDMIEAWANGKTVTVTFFNDEHAARFAEALRWTALQ
jgi:hypothetical protein